MIVKHGEGVSTHPPHDPQLWLKIEVTNESDKNWVYDINSRYNDKLDYFNDRHTTFQLKLGIIGHWGDGSRSSLGTTYSNNGINKRWSWTRNTFIFGFTFSSPFWSFWFRFMIFSSPVTFIEILICCLKYFFVWNSLCVKLNFI